VDRGTIGGALTSIDDVPRSASFRCVVHDDDFEAGINLGTKVAKARGEKLRTIGSWDYDCHERCMREERAPARKATRTGRARDAARTERLRYRQLICGQMRGDLGAMSSPDT
jgi:hypothetical protein